MLSESKTELIDDLQGLVETQMIKHRQRAMHVKKTRSGTHLYCPACGNVEECPVVSLSEAGEPSQRRLYHIGHEDVNLFRRARKCDACEAVFVTNEVPEDLVNELIELRDALATVKTSAEDYIRESSAAAKSLGKLSRSLKVLKALKLYQSH